MENRLNVLNLYVLTQSLRPYGQTSSTTAWDMCTVSNTIYRIVIFNRCKNAFIKSYKVTDLTIFKQRLKFINTKV
jgi:hypothetical protein